MNTAQALPMLNPARTSLRVTNMPGVTARTATLALMA